MAELGDIIASALKTIGVDSGKMESWIGAPCGCEERQEKLNSLSLWAKRVMAGKVEMAKEHLQRITS